MESHTNWQSKLFDGLVTDPGRPVKVSTGSITKANREKQLSERMPSAMEMTGDNTRNRGLHRNSKQKFSVHRSMAFLEQE